MIKDVSKILVVDLELTCWDGLPPEGEQPEIIQVGWAWVRTDTLDLVDKGMVMVKPQRSKVSERCTALTGITPKMAKGGIPFQDMCKFIVRKLGCRSRPWAAWGDDEVAVRAQCADMGAEFPFSESCVNVQLMYTLALGIDKPRPSLESAMADLGIAPCGEAHRADNDAWDTAAILRRILARNRADPIIVPNGALGPTPGGAA